MDKTISYANAALTQTTAEAALQPLLDSYAKQQHSAQELAARLVVICAQQPAATWQALSLLDRYQRRGVLTTALAREIKQGLNAIAFGSGAKHALVAPDAKAERGDVTAAFPATKQATDNGRNEQTAWLEAADNTSQLKTARRDTTEQTVYLQTDLHSASNTAQSQTAHLQQTPHDPAMTAQLRTSQFHGDGTDRTSHLDSASTSAETPHALDTHYYSNTELERGATPQPSREQTLPRIARTEQEQLEYDRVVLTRATLAQSPSIRAGTSLLNRYVLIEPLSNGGIGMMFKAFDHQRAALPESQRYVAIKCLHEQWQSEPRAIAALQHEYLQSQLLSHPNIAKVYDFHQSNGLSFLALELVEGDSLTRVRERITPRRLPTARALAIVREVGMAIAHAHEHGVLHGNLQPESVVVTRTGSIRVKEFGQATAWLETAATAENTAIYDIKPAAPEQRYRSPQQKSAIPADAADDIYSLACIAYELLCGSPPDVSAITRSRPTHARHLPARQWRALQRGLADDRSQRGNDVRQWLDDLDLSTAEIRLPSISVLESEFAKERRMPPTWVMTAGIGVVVAALAIFVAIGVWNSRSVTTATATPESDVIASPIDSAPTSYATAATSADDNSSLASTNETPPAETPPPQAGNIVTLSQSPEMRERDHESVPSNAVTSNRSQTTGASTAKLSTVSFSQSRYEVPPDASVARLTIQRNGASNQALTLQWFSIEGTAKADVDYVRDGNTTVQIKPGMQTAEVIIPLIRSGVRDRAVWFEVRIRATSDAMPGDNVGVTVNLQPTMTK